MFHNVAIVDGIAIYIMAFVEKATGFFSIEDKKRPSPCIEMFPNGADLTSHAAKSAFLNAPLRPGSPAMLRTALATRHGSMPGLLMLAFHIAVAGEAERAWNRSVTILPVPPIALLPRNVGSLNTSAGFVYIFVGSTPECNAGPAIPFSFIAAIAVLLYQFAAQFAACPNVCGPNT